MPGKNLTQSDQSGTDEHTDAEARDGAEDTPFTDPLEAMFGGAEEDGADDEADAEDEDEGQDADAEEEAEDESEDDEEADEESEESEDEETDEDEAEESDEDEDGEDEESDEAKDDKKWKEQLKKLTPEAQRIVLGQRKALIKLRGKKKELKDQLADVERERDEYKEATVATQKTPIRIEANADMPLSDFVTEEEVTKHMANAQRTIEWCEDNEDGGEAPDGQGGIKELTKQDVRQIRRNAEAVVNKQGPHRIQWLKDYAAQTEEARKVYPQLFKAGDERKQAEELLKKYPHLHSYANHALMLGDMIIGQQVREKKLVTVKPGKGKQAEEKPKPKPKPSSLASSSAPAAKPKVKPKPGNLTQLRKDFRTGKGDPLEFMLAAGRRA